MKKATFISTKELVYVTRAEKYKPIWSLHIFQIPPLYTSLVLLSFLLQIQFIVIKVINITYTTLHKTHNTGLQWFHCLKYFTSSLSISAR
jgi:hypothetical protein